MVKLLAKLFIKGGDEASERNAYGVLCGIVGIMLNVMLCALKLFVGALSGSIAVTADAFNNLSDAGSSFITTVGFKLAAQKPDPGHPFGHGRIEYLSSLMVAMMILLMAFELLKSSVEKIINPESVELSLVSVAILMVSVAVKLYMFAYNRIIGRRIDSPAMKAVATDSLFDAITTSVVLAAMAVGSFLEVNIDGYCGCVVSALIFIAGFSAARDTINPLLGQPVKREFAEKIEKIVMSYDSILGIHDLVVHDYGPGRLMISLHAEVPSSGDFLELHDDIDNIEKRLCNELGCSAVIHMDPIQVDDIRTSALKMEVGKLVKEIDENITIHDFRVVHGKTHTNLIFDVVVPFSLKLTDEQVRAKVAELVSTLDGNCFAVVTIDKNFVE